MKKTNMLYAVILILLAVNIWQLFGKRLFTVSPSGREPKGYIIDKLRFDEIQIKKYNQLITQHRTAIKEKEQKLLQEKRELYFLLADLTNTSDTIHKVKLERLGKIHSEIEGIHFAHFQKIQSICRTSQRVHFHALIPELPELFHPRPPKRGK